MKNTQIIWRDTYHKGTLSHQFIQPHPCDIKAVKAFTLHVYCFNNKIISVTKQDSSNDLWWYKAKPHGCCIFSMILHEAPSMETTTPKGEWFPCWVAEWSIMENMQQQMWFCFYPSPISINISSYVYNALRLTPEIWFWAMPFASFQIDINKYFAIVSPRCQVISNCDVMSPWITWQNNRLMISRFAILSREYLLQTVLCNQ